MILSVGDMIRPPDSPLYEIVEVVFSEEWCQNIYRSLSQEHQFLNCKGEWVTINKSKFTFSQRMVDKWGIPKGSVIPDWYESDLPTLNHPRNYCREKPVNMT